MPESPSGCVFCDVIAGREPRILIHEWVDTLAIVPLYPVVDGHVIFIPKTHGARPDDIVSDSGVAFMRAVQWAGTRLDAYNVIVSVGTAATQTIHHVHIHVVPRVHGDGLVLPWSSH